MNWEILWQFSIVVVVCYFLGNINFARFLSRLRNDDITKQGSGNPGTMNVLRSYGFLLGALTLFFDVLKGAAPVIAVYFIFKDRKPYLDSNLDYGLIAMFVAALSVIIGHIYPLIRNFRGGKGVASTLGVYFIITSVIGFWYVGLIIFAVGVLYILFFEWGSIGSLIMTTAFPVFTVIYFILNYEMSGWLIFIICANAALCFLSYWRHRSNLAKLVKGKENRTRLRAMLSLKRKKKEEQKDTVQKNAEQKETEQIVTEEKSTNT